MTRHFRLQLLAVASLLTHEAFGAGTPAGTAVVNQAQVSFTLGGVAGTSPSNVARFLVAEILDVNVTLRSERVSVIAGESRRTLLFTVTNLGNGDERFPLALQNTLAGDDFDPIAASTSIYFDTDGSGDLSDADVIYTAGSNDPDLAPDAGVGVLLVNDIPSTVADGQLGRSQLVARAATGTGVPGTSFAGLGSDGTDAVAGASGAESEAFGEYAVGDVQVALVKSATVINPAGGVRATAGARIDYRIVVNVSGSGVARQFTVNDPIPANTTYVPGSLRLNETALTDASDTDVGEFQSGAAARIRVALGDMTQVAGARTVAFSVVIN